MTPQQRNIIKKCQSSTIWFLRNYGKLKHPSAGILKFHPFSYQREAIKSFRTNRLNIFRKCRQSGASKISGAFATWFGMFHSNKTILIVSRTDNDAMTFLRDHVIFLFENLPGWMKDLWRPIKLNEHEIAWPNGSRVQSLTSHPDVLRSNASSLNIIDEAAFIQNMDVLWAGGWPTLQHGGNVIVVSTTCGVGNWYWATMTDAEAGVNSFNPIIINWWDMDWAIEYTDPITRQKARIAPRDGIRKSTLEEESTYGPYWSPWLQEQYDHLQSKGEAWKFKQEILADFIGSGNTVLDPSVIRHVSTTTRDPIQIVRGNQTYVHPVSGESSYLNFDFKESEEGLWIWKKPVAATPEKKRGDQLIQHGTAAHSYVMGVDIATGKGRDYSAIEVFDIDDQEQVAEFMARCLPRDLVLYIDRIGRWYNCALAVVERNNGGDTLIDSLRYDIMYPRIWRKKDINDKPTAAGSHRARALKVAPYGFSTSVASKPTLNKFMIDFIRDKLGDGYTIYSTRLLQQFQTYVRKRDRAGRDTGKTEAEDGAGNFDDLVMGTGLALIGTSDAYIADSGNLMPFSAGSDFRNQEGPILLSDKSMIDLQKGYAEMGGPGLLMPMALSPDDFPDVGAQRQLEAFTFQLGAIPVGQQGPIVTPPKYYFDRK